MTLYLTLLLLILYGYSYRQNYLFWTDTTQRSIMRSNLDGTNVATVLDQGLTQPGNKILLFVALNFKYR